TTTDETSIEYQRVQISIRAYHLDHHKLNRERQTIYYKVEKFVTMYRKYNAIWQANRSDLGARTCATEAFANLRTLIAPTAPYSAAARAYLKEYRKENPHWSWIDQLLTAS